MTRRNAPWLAALVLVGLAGPVGLAGCSKSDPAADKQAATADTPASASAAAATDSEAATEPAGEKAPAAKGYGAPLGDSPQVALADVLAAPDSYADKTIRTEGLVRKACSEKGCWMEVASSADEAAATTRVTFKDYGFFVPTDSAGSQARLEGQVVIKTVSKGDVEHLEAEGAKFAAKADDGSAREVQFVANGVELIR